MKSKLSQIALVCAAAAGGLGLLAVPAAAEDYTYEYDYDYYTEPSLPPAMTEPIITPTITDLETPPTAQGDFVTKGDFGRGQGGSGGQARLSSSDSDFFEGFLGDIRGELDDLLGAWDEGVEAEALFGEGVIDDLEVRTIPILENDESDTPGDAFFVRITPPDGPQVSEDPDPRTEGPAEPEDGTLDPFSFAPDSVAPSIAVSEPSDRRGQAEPKGDLKIGSETDATNTRQGADIEDDGVVREVDFAEGSLPRFSLQDTEEALQALSEASLESLFAPLTSFSFPSGDSEDLSGQLDLEQGIDISSGPAFDLSLDAALQAADQSSGPFTFATVFSF